MTAGREPTNRAMLGARLSVRNQAVLRGEVLPVKRGIQHKRSQPYKMRVEAKQLKAIANQISHQWWQKERTSAYYYL